MSPAYHQVHAEGSTVMTESEAIREKGPAYDPKANHPNDPARELGIPPGPTGALREQTDPLNPAIPAGSSKIDDEATELARENAEQVRHTNPEALSAEAKQRDPEVIKAINEKNDEARIASGEPLVNTGGSADGFVNTGEVRTYTGAGQNGSAGQIGEGGHGSQPKSDENTKSDHSGASGSDDKDAIKASDT